MWYAPDKYELDEVEDLNQDFLNNLKGELDTKEAKVTLAKFRFNYRINIWY